MWKIITLPLSVSNLDNLHTALLNIIISPMNVTNKFHVVFFISVQQHFMIILYSNQYFLMTFAFNTVRNKDVLLKLHASTFNKICSMSKGNYLKAHCFLFIQNQLCLKPGKTVLPEMLKTLTEQNSLLQLHSSYKAFIRCAVSYLYSILSIIYE